MKRQCDRTLGAWLLRAGASAAGAGGRGAEDGHLWARVAMGRKVIFRQDALGLYFI